MMTGNGLDCHRCAGICTDSFRAMTEIKTARNQSVTSQCLYLGAGGAKFTTYHNIRMFAAVINCMLNTNSPQPGWQNLMTLE